MAYTNDSKPSGTTANDVNSNKVQWNDAVYTWNSSSASWDNAGTYSNDTKPSGSYSNDVKPT